MNDLLLFLAAMYCSVGPTGVDQNLSVLVSAAVGLVWGQRWTIGGDSSREQRNGTDVEAGKRGYQTIDLIVHGSREHAVGDIESRKGDTASGLAMSM
jgi:hypothetical protein